MATTATYEVPASAKDGDEIKLTVTAEDGETASDTVYVGGFTILKVEPLAQGNTYKYVKAYFSSALTSLSPSEIEIRGKKDQKLYSIQTAVLASDGMAADLTLYGSSSEDDTSFLRANTTYVMTLTQNGQSTSLEFELPAYATDMVVTSVDMSKNTITTSGSFRTGWENAYAPGTFNVAGKYTGNLGTLIGRTVNYGYDTNLNLTSFSLDDAEVVYGAMKFVNDDNDLETAYFKDTLTGETYKWNKDTFTASKNATLVYTAHDGKSANVRANTTYNYTKLVLNPDGTVSTANIVQNFPQNLYVTEVDGTKVIQDKNNAFDLDGYTIVKDDEYVATADLEIGDVVFINTGLKFADVYTNDISGELSNVISGKLDIDETTYNWNGAQYYDDGDEEYKTLSTADTASAQAYLNSLDTETDTTIWIARDKSIKYLDGTVVGVKKYTNKTYLITKTAETYTESLKHKFNVDVFDGEDTTTVTIDLKQLKFYKGVAGKYELAPAAEADWANKTTGAAWNFTGNSDAKYDATGDKNPHTALTQGHLVKFMYDEDENLVGLSDGEDAEIAKIATAGDDSSLDGKAELGTTNSPNLTNESSKLMQDITVTATGVYTMGDYTTLWIWNEKNPKIATDPTSGNGDDTYTKVTLTDFDNEIETDNNAKFEALTYRVDGTKVKDLVVKIKNDGAYAKAEENFIAGVIDDITYKNDDTDTDQVVKTITIYGTDGAKAKYTADGNLKGITGGYKKGSYVVLTQNKTTELITAAEMKADWSMATNNPTDKLVTDHATTSFHNDKLILRTTVAGDNIELTAVSGGTILKRYQKEGSWKYDIVDYTDVNVLDADVAVWYNTTNVSKDGKKIQSDIIVVEALAKTPTPVASLVRVTPGVGNVLTGNVISTANTTLSATFLGTGEIASVQWYMNGVAGSGATAKQADVTLTDLGTVSAGKKVYVKFVDADGETYVSDTYTFADPVATSLSATSGSITNDKGNVTFNVLDQFDVVANVTATCTTFTADSTGNLTTAAFSCTSGVCTISAAGSTAAANDDYSLTIDLDGAGAGTTTATYALTVSGQTT